MKKRKLLSLVLSLLLLIGICPTTVFAADTEELWVNGVNIITATDNKVSCGTGEAAYDAVNRTLTLENATIDTGYNRTGINAGSSSGDKELTVKLVGTNTIAAKDGEYICVGIYTYGELVVLGDGSLDIATATPDTSQSTCGIYAWQGCIINDATISMKNTTLSSINVYSAGIDVNESESAFICDGASLEIDGYDIAINVPTGHIDINDSNIDITNANRGVNGGVEIDNFVINHSTIDCSVSGDNAVAVANGCDILVDNSKMTLSSTSSNAIFSEASLRIVNDSEIDATGFFPALYGKTSIDIYNSIVIAVSTDDSAIFTGGMLTIKDSDVTANSKWAGLQSNGRMSIQDSDVESTSTNDIGIFSRGSMYLYGGKIHAKGGTGYAAIAARVVKVADEVARREILLENHEEKNGGKVAVSDWFLHTGSGQTRSWTSFVDKDSGAIEVNTNGSMTNALNEVWMVATTCTFGHTESGWIIDKVATHTEEGSRHKECTVCNEKLKTEAIAKLTSGDVVVAPDTNPPSRDVIVHSDTGTKAEYEDGSVFDDNIELSITTQSKEEMDKLNGNIDKSAKGFTLAGLYDIQLLKDGVSIQPNGKITISIPLTDEMKLMTDLKIVYIDNDGNVTIIPSKIIDGKIVFTTDHFSHYGVIGKEKTDSIKPENPQTGDNVPVIPLLVLAGLSVITAAALMITGKKKV